MSTAAGIPGPRMDPAATVCRLTLLLMVLYGARVWQLKIPTVMLAAAGLAVPGLVMHRGFWAILTLLQLVSVLPRAYLVDNHKLLLLYWSLALALSGGLETLRRNARCLIGSCFLWAAFWKFRCQEYLDGSFLHYTFLTDERFTFFSHWVGGVSLADLATNAERVRQLLTGRCEAAALLDTPRLATVARCASYWTLLVETGIGVTFLAPLQRAGIARTRNALLLQFIVLTYPVATVIGFGWLLTIMGYAQCEAAEHRWRCLYLAVFVLLQAFLIPWGALLLPEAQS